MIYRSTFGNTRPFSRLKLLSEKIYILMIFRDFKAYNVPFIVFSSIFRKKSEYILMKVPNVRRFLSV